MPSSATITTFHTFAANTKARASQVNTNFSNLRGHSLPINTDTATASDMTFDIGADDHRWRSGYFGSIDLQTSTTTATLILKGDTTATTGAFLFQIEGVTKGRIDTDGYDGTMIKPLSIPEAALATIRHVQYQVFINSGNWTAPAGVTQVLIYQWGGGGGGEGVNAGAGAGGAGAAPSWSFVGVTPLSVYAVVVGAGGAAGNNAAGGQGGQSSFDSVVGYGGLGGGSAGTGVGGVALPGGANGGPAPGKGQDMPNFPGGVTGTNTGGGGAGPGGQGGAGGFGVGNAGVSGDFITANSGAGGGGGNNAIGGVGGKGRVMVIWS